MFSKKCALVFVSALCFCACRQKGNVESVIKPEDTMETIQGKRIVCEDTFPGILDVVVADKYLVTISNNRTPLFSVLTKDGTHVSDFGYKGHSNSEFMTCSLLKQYTKDGCLVADDINANKFKLIDLHKTIEEGKTVVKRDIKMPPASLESWYVDDETQIVLQQVMDNFLLYHNGDRIKNAKRLYEDHTPSFPIYHSRMCVNSTGRKVALPMFYMDRINFYDFKTDRLSSVSLYGAPDSSDKELHVYYCSTCTDGDKVYALYMNQSSEESYRLPKSMEIHVLDFEGAYIGRFSVSEYLTHISCDGEFLYGVERSGDIYRYKLPM